MFTFQHSMCKERPPCWWQFISQAYYVGASNSCNDINGLDLKLKSISEIKLNAQEVEIGTMAIQFTYHQVLHYSAKTSWTLRVNIMKWLSLNYHLFLISSATPSLKGNKHIIKGFVDHLKIWVLAQGVDISKSFSSRIANWIEQRIIFLSKVYKRKITQNRHRAINTK